jgi:hypothetical protein
VDGGGNVLWKGVTFLFSNSTATTNVLSDQTIASPGLTNIAVGECIYVDLDRANDRLSAAAWVGATIYAPGNQVTNGVNVYQCVTGGTSAASGGPTGTGSNIPDGSGALVWKWIGLTPLAGGNGRVGKASLATVGSGPAGLAPGSRYVIAWRTPAGYFARGNPYPIGTVSPFASTSTPGIVYMSSAPAVASHEPGRRQRRGEERRQRRRDPRLLRKVIATGLVNVGGTLTMGQAGQDAHHLGTLTVDQLLKLASGLDAATGITLTIGGTTATQVSLAKVAVLTRILGTLRVDGASDYFADINLNTHNITGGGSITATTFNGALNGNAATATTATNQSGGTVNATTAQVTGNATGLNGGLVALDYASATCTNGTGATIDATHNGPLSGWSVGSIKGSSGMVVGSTGVSVLAGGVYLVTISVFLHSTDGWANTIGLSMSPTTGGVDGGGSMEVVGQSSTAGVVYGANYGASIVYTGVVVTTTGRLIGVYLALDNGTSITNMAMKSATMSVVRIA